MKKLLLLLSLFAVPCLAQQINPATQINWPLVTGSGAPTIACTSTNYGQPYVDVSSGTSYSCVSSGWVATGSGASGSSLGILVTDPQFGSGCANAADPSGVKDSTCAIEAAAAYVETQITPLGGAVPTLYFPSGSYKLSGDPRFSCYMNVMGAGPNASIFDETNDDEGVTVVNSGTPQPNSWNCDGVMQGIGFHAPGTPAYTATQLQLFNVPGYTLRDIRVDGGAGRGIVLIGSTERVKAYHLEIDTVRWPLLWTGNENHLWGLNIAAPGELPSGYCFGPNCINGVPPNNQWKSGTLVSANGNGTTASFYVQGTYYNSTPDSTAPISVGNYFNVSGTTGTVLDGTYEATAVTNGVTTDPSGSCTSAAPCFEVQAASSVSGTATVSSATWLPAIIKNPHDAVYFGGANDLIVGGSIKTLQHSGGIQIENTFGGKISSIYFEGFPVNGQPTLNGDFAFGGYVAQTTLTEAVPSSGRSTTTVADNSWFDEFLNDPSDANTTWFPMMIMPQDYLAGSTAPSAYVPGVERGQYEEVYADMTQGNQVILEFRNEGGTAPSGIAWPAGSIISMMPASFTNYGPLEIANNHLEAMAPPGSNWFADCSDGTVNTCATILIGGIPNGNNVTNTSQVANYKYQVSLVNNEWRNNTDASPATAENFGEGWVKCAIAGACYVHFGDLTPFSSGSNVQSGTVYSVSSEIGGFQDVPTSAGSLPTATLLFEDGSQFSFAGTSALFQAKMNFWANPDAVTNVTYGQQFDSTFCDVDTPNSSQTHSQFSLCIQGGPGHTSLWEGAYQWSGTAWNQIFSLGARASITVAAQTIPAASGGVPGCSGQTTTAIVGAVAGNTAKFQQTTLMSGVAGWQSGALWFDDTIGTGNLTWEVCNSSSSAQTVPATTWTVSLQ